MNIEIGKLMKITSTSKQVYFAIIDKIEKDYRVFTKQYLNYDPFDENFYFVKKPKPKQKFIYLIDTTDILTIENPSIQEEKLYTYCRKHPNLFENDIMNLYVKYLELYK